MEKWHIFKSFEKFENELFYGVTQKETSLPFNLSLALHTGENRNSIIENRKYFSSFFPDSCKFLSLSQIHSSIVIDADNYDLSKSWDGMLNIKADAAISSAKDNILTILTADCLPILFYDPVSHIVGAAHAGWKGSAANIAVKTVRKMEEAGSSKKNIHIAIGPGIGGCCYEVGEDVAMHFTEYSKALHPLPSNKWMLDLAKVNEIQLINAGIPERQVENSKLCTACNSKNFFSYRKENGCSGRFITFIGMKR